MSPHKKAMYLHPPLHCGNRVQVSLQMALRDTAFVVSLKKGSLENMLVKSASKIFPST